MKFKPHFAIIFSIFILGCGTTPVSIPNATQVSSDRIIAFQNKINDDMATIIVIRDQGFLGHGCYYAFDINGILASRLDPGEIVRHYVAPGRMTVGAGRDPQGHGLCAIGGKHAQLEIELKPRETKYFRMLIESGGECNIVQS